MLIKRFIIVLMKGLKSRAVPVMWINRGDTSFLSSFFMEDAIPTNLSNLNWKIESIAERTNSLGEQPLWQGYVDNNIAGPMRMPNGVRTTSEIGRILTSLVIARKPNTIVEFGTAFGVSGMYFLTGLAKNGKGFLFSFEPNPVWAALASMNLARIGDQYKLTVGTFEENISNVLKTEDVIDIAFIDAIHTREFVIPQVDLVISKCSKGSIIILDDINFSGEMKKIWHELSIDKRFSASLELDHRVGVLELK